MKTLKGAILPEAVFRSKGDVPMTHGSSTASGPSINTCTHC